MRVVKNKALTIRRLYKYAEITHENERDISLQSSQLTQAREGRYVDNMGLTKTAKTKESW